jgi:hypothetical protein
MLCARMITLHYIIFELLPFVLFHTILSGAYLKKYLRYQLKTSLVDRSYWGGVQHTRMITYHALFFSYCPLLFSAISIHIGFKYAITSAISFHYQTTSLKIELFCSTTYTFFQWANTFGVGWPCWHGSFCFTNVHPFHYRSLHFNAILRAFEFVKHTFIYNYCN